MKEIEYIPLDNEEFFEIVNKNGELTEYQVLLAFDNKKNGKSYMIFTDAALNVYAAGYDPDDLDKGFSQIETQEEWEMVEQVFSSIL